MTNKPQRIRRAKHEADYFVCLRSVPQNTTLSYEAVGMLAYLLSKPDTWDIRIEDLKRDGCGETKVRRVLKELRMAGHVRLERDVDSVTKRNIAFYYTIHEVPLPDDQRDTKVNLIAPEKPLDGKPQVEKPVSGSATCGKQPPLDNKESLDNRDSDSKEKKEEEKPSIFEVIFENVNVGEITSMLRDEVSDLIEEFDYDTIYEAVRQGVISHGAKGINMRWLRNRLEGKHGRKFDGGATDEPTTLDEWSYQEWLKDNPDDGEKIDITAELEALYGGGTSE